MKEGLLLLEQVKKAKTLNKGIMVMPQFFPPEMTSTETNTLSWRDFKQRMHPIGQLILPGTSIECLVTPKNIGWCAEDINTYVGTDDRQINEIDDLEDEEGIAWFNVNFEIAEYLLNNARPEMQINIGFNPQEFSVGHHSVARLHSHIRGIGHELDSLRRRKQSWQEFDWFDKLGFIEPFSIVHNDFINNLIASGRLKSFLYGYSTQELGYSTMLLKRGSDLSQVFPEIKDMYHAMKEEYSYLEDVFTGKLMDPKSGRYIPRPEPERIRRLMSYIDDRGSWLSKESIDKLNYLAQYIRIAEPRNKPREIRNAATAYITRGLAGAMTLSLHDGEEQVRFDFLPRVITTTGVTKTISGRNMATIIAKEKQPAEKHEREVIEQYQQDIDTFLKSKYPDNYRS
jgi:hypothetical protein